MTEQDKYDQLLDDESIDGIKERRAAIGRAIDEILNQLDQTHVQRKRLDEQDENLYEMLMKLDAAHGAISHGKRYTEQAKKLPIRRFWTDDTYLWLERFLCEWAAKQLLDGPKSAANLWTSGDMILPVNDVITIMSHHPELFLLQRGNKPKQKYARTSMEWSLASGMNRFVRHTQWRFWNVEASFRKSGESVLSHFLNGCM